MEITKKQLKRIIAEEIGRMSEEDSTFHLDDELDSDVGSISESEGVAIVQQLADLISQSGLTAVENPDEAYELVMGLGKAALLPFFALTTGYAATSLKDAVDYLTNKDQKSEEK